jgi:hypothetical protein
MEPGDMKDVCQTGIIPHEVPPFDKNLIVKNKYADGDHSRETLIL